MTAPLQTKPKMSVMQERCLFALACMTFPQGERCVPFCVIEDATSMTRKDVRRSVRALFRKGLAEFHSGLCNEDGEFAGSGYCISQEGRKAAEVPMEMPA